MEAQLLDLRSERCPMALLRAKRYSAEVAGDCQWMIAVQERSSMHDITRYFSTRGWRVVSQTRQEDYLITLYPEDTNHNA